MVHLSEIPEKLRNGLVNQDLPEFETTPWAAGPPLAERRIALITTAGLHRKDDPPFALGSGDYRIIPSDADMDDLVMSHISTNFDGTGFYRDLNVPFPIDRLRGARGRRRHRLGRAPALRLHGRDTASSDGASSSRSRPDHAGRRGRRHRLLPGLTAMHARRRRAITLLRRRGDPHHLHQPDPGPYRAAQAAARARRAVSSLDARSARLASRSSSEGFSVPASSCWRASPDLSSRTSRTFGPTRTRMARVGPARSTSPSRPRR